MFNIIQTIKIFKTQFKYSSELWKQWSSSIGYFEDNDTMKCKKVYFLCGSGNKFTFCPKLYKKNPASKKFALKTCDNKPSK